jgi:hypothetical protein
MTCWNPGLFLVIKRWWAGVALIVLGVLALWKLIELVRQIKANLPRLEKVCRDLAFRNQLGVLTVFSEVIVYLGYVRGVY